jgi:beta-D-galactosyl-(1->4)-L-rhamnose phosphorylase
LSHLLGVDREIGRSLSKDKFAYKKTDDQHFIMEDVEGDVDFGRDVDNIFVLGGDTRVLAEKDVSPRISVHNFRRGRSVYFSGYTYTSQNTRLLHRSIYWAAGYESDFVYWTCSNIHTECAYYPESNKLIVINNSDREEETGVFDSNRNCIDVSVEPLGIEIIDVVTGHTRSAEWGERRLSAGSEGV